MLEATITGGLVSMPVRDAEGALYCTVNSDEAHRSVRVYFRNQQQADMVQALPKHGRLTVSGRLRAVGAISDTGRAVAFLTIYAQQLKIHEARP